MSGVLLSSRRLVPALAAVLIGSATPGSQASAVPSGQDVYSIVEDSDRKQNQGDLGAAEKLLREALGTGQCATAEASLDAAILISKLATVLTTNGSYPEAKACHQRALSIYRSLLAPEDLVIATELHNFALTEDWSGDSAASLVLLEEAARMLRKRYAGYSLYKQRKALQTGSLLLIVLKNLAENRRYLSDYDGALQYATERLELARKMYDIYDIAVADAFHDLGRTQLEIGNYKGARDNLQKAIAISKRNATHRGAHVGMLIDLSHAQDELNDAAGAEASFDEAIRILQSPGGNDDALAYIVLTTSGSFKLAHGKRDEARKDLTKALELHDRSAQIGAGKSGDLQTVLFKLAGLALDAKDQPAADEYMRRLAAEVAQAKRPLDLLIGYFGLSDLNARSGRVAEAIFWGKQAVNTLQTIRQNHKSGDLSQPFFVKDKSYIYRHLAALLIGQGRLSEAQEVMAMLKEEEYFRYVRGGPGDRGQQRSSTAEAEQPWIEAYPRIRDRLAEIGVERAKFKAMHHRSKEQEASLAKLEAEWRVGYQEFEQFLARMQADFAKLDEQIRNRQPGVQNLKFAKALQRTLGELGAGTVLINYVMDKNTFYVLLTTADTQLHCERAIGIEALSAKVFAFRASLVPRNGMTVSRIQEQAAELYDILIGCIRNDLKQAKAQTLMISLEGPLRYLPVSALYDRSEKKYLIETYPLAIFTEAARDKINDRPASQGWSIAALGLSSKVEGFDALKEVETELRAIVREEGEKTGVLPGQRYLNLKFTRAQLQQSLEGSDFPVVHIASHFQFQVGSETKSFLVLGDGSPLTVADMKSFKFNKDLVTFSACNTDVSGGVNAQGAEIEGLAVIAQMQDAKAVIATLWEVADPSTARLMEAFYRERTRSNLNKAEALRRAQLHLLKGDGNGNAPYAHPYHWGAFVLSGNWR